MTYARTVYITIPPKPIDNTEPEHPQHSHYTGPPSVNFCYSATDPRQHRSVDRVSRGRSLMTSTRCRRQATNGARRRPARSCEGVYTSAARLQQRPVRLPRRAGRRAAWRRPPIGKLTATLRGQFCPKATKGVVRSRISTTPLLSWRSGVSRESCFPPNSLSAAADLHWWLWSPRQPKVRIRPSPLQFGFRHEWLGRWHVEAKGVRNPNPRFIRGDARRSSHGGFRMPGGKFPVLQGGDPASGRHLGTTRANRDRPSVERCLQKPSAEGSREVVSDPDGNAQGLARLRHRILTALRRHDLGDPI